jgi:hypothetical protein
VGDECQVVREGDRRDEQADRRDADPVSEEFRAEIGKGRKDRGLFVVRGVVMEILCVRAPGERPVTPDELEV